MNFPKIFLVVLFSVAVSFSFQSPAYSETVVAGIGEWPPWTMSAKNNDGAGIFADIFKTALRQAGHQPEIIAVPHLRKHYEWGKRVHAELG